ncbi:MAG: hypothetical protein JNL17_02425 [Cyclobacteriaceae bacterium]|nr:hypothetical protein [Cyclobacteriaceae bacterium]
MIRWFFFVSFCTALFWGCGPSTLDRVQLEQYLANPENGLVQEVNRGAVSARIQYLPKDMLFAAELQTAHDFDRYRDSLNLVLDSLHYFRLTLAQNGKAMEYTYGTTAADVQSLQSYVVRDLAPTLRLRAGETEAGLFDAVFAPTYGSSTGTSWLLVFKGAPLENQDMEIAGEDFRFGLGHFNVRFSAERVRQVPLLKKTINS